MASAKRPDDVPSATARRNITNKLKARGIPADLPFMNTSNPRTRRQLAQDLIEYLRTQDHAMG